MSARRFRRRFAMQWLDVFSREDLTMTAKLVLHILADMQGDNADAIVSAQTLARMVGANRSTVLRALAQLVAAGELEAQKRWKERKLPDGSTLMSPRPSSYRVTKLRNPPIEQKAFFGGGVSQPPPSGVSQPASGVSQPASGVSQPASGKSAPDPDQDPISDPITDPGRGARRAPEPPRAAFVPFTEELAGPVRAALVVAYREERGIRLDPSSRRNAESFRAWLELVTTLEPTTPAHELAKLTDRAARAYLRTKDTALERRGWPLEWLVDRAPALLASSSSSSVPGPSIAQQREALELEVERAERNLRHFRAAKDERSAETWASIRDDAQRKLDALELSRKGAGTHRLAASARSSRSTTARGM